MPARDVRRTSPDGTGLEIYVPGSCLGAGRLTIHFSPYVVPRPEPVVGPQVTCLANNLISSP
jgi:hypothetical protein